jgi:hypothetical protein
MVGDLRGTAHPKKNREKPRRQMFKTIYFPPNRTHSKHNIQVTLAIPSPTVRGEREFAKFIRDLSSTDIRRILGDPYYEAVVQKADSEDRTVSNYCIRQLRTEYSGLELRNGGIVQRTLEGGVTNGVPSQPLGITFRDSKKSPIHRWYPYVEGFSAAYVREVLSRKRNGYSRVYDPFGGCGTVLLEASESRIPSCFAEVNPFAAFVASTKVNSVRNAQAELSATLASIDQYSSRLNELGALSKSISLEHYYKAFPGRDYFFEGDLRELLAALEFADSVGRRSLAVRDLLRVAVGSIAVACSNMTRRADLRRRRLNEYKKRVVNVTKSLRCKLKEVKDDLRIAHPIVETVWVAEDARRPHAKSGIDLALTSPPYLNGTNYFRNTKLELWLLGFIDSEADLANFTRRAVASGINNITNDRPPSRSFNSVEEIATKIDPVAYDSRIPRLVRCYFSDMAEVLESVHSSLKENGLFILDIGDSKFCGVHVPTDRLLCEIATLQGFRVKRSRELARRYSLDKSPLRQVELTLEKPLS